MIGGSTWLTPLHSLVDSTKAVDVGCGTGVATIELARTLPLTKVYGLDISPVPEDVQQAAPPNTVWAVGDVLDVDYDHHGEYSDTMRREIFALNGLDYIFGRMLFLGINDWQRYFYNASTSLKPGGMIEHQDLDWKFYRVGTSECLSDEWEWHRKVVRAAEQSGLSTHAGSNAAHLMEAVGLEIVSIQSFEFSFVPSIKTPNSEAMGRYVQDKLMPQYPELLRRMLGAQGILGEELEELTKNCLRDISCEEGLHQKYTVTIAKKS